MQVHVSVRSSCLVGAGETFWEVTLPHLLPGGCWRTASAGAGDGEEQPGVDRWKLLLFETLVKHYGHTDRPALLPQHLTHVYTAITDLLGDWFPSTSLLYAKNYLTYGLKKMNINRFTGTNVTLVTRFEDVCRRTAMTGELTGRCREGGEGFVSPSRTQNPA